MSFFKKIFGSNENKEPKQEANNNLDSFKEVPWMTDLRLKNISICLDAGFKPTNSLPTDLDVKLRPSIEIAKRLRVITSLTLWVMVSEKELESSAILTFVDENNLKDFMEEDEKDILNKSRDDEEARDSIGWKFENAWPLAWYFGYKEPEITGKMMSGDEMQVILRDFSCLLGESIENWVKDRKTISEEKLIEKQDLFYCLHNAVRSAQLGGETVPNGFDPMGNGGVIHERRHSLTWILSEGVCWAETDLST